MPHRTVHPHPKVSSMERLCHTGQYTRIPRCPQWRGRATQDSTPASQGVLNGEIVPHRTVHLHPKVSSMERLCHTGQYTRIPRCPQWRGCATQDSTPTSQGVLNGEIVPHRTVHPHPKVSSKERSGHTGQYTRIPRCPQWRGCATQDSTPTSQGVLNGEIVPHRTVHPHPKVSLMERLCHTGQYTHIPRCLR